MPKGGIPPPPGWQERFLEAFKDTMIVSQALRKTGLKRTFIYEQRRKDPEFAARWAEIEEESTEVLEQIAVRRAAQGSDTLLIFLLKARRPNVYRENIYHDHSHQHTVSGGVELLLPEGTQPIDISADKRREAAKMLLMAAPDDASEITDAEVVDEPPGFIEDDLDDDEFDQEDNS